MACHHQPIAAIVARSHQHQHMGVLGPDPGIDGLGHGLTSILHHLIKAQCASIGGSFNASHFFSSDDLQGVSLHGAI
jgi:hypothetical protein